MSREIMQQALGAIKAARLSHIDFDYKPHEGYMLDIIGKLEAALAQPEQEPDAWMVTVQTQNGGKETYPVSGRYKDVLDSCDFGDPIPLYTAPLSKQWVGLTDEDAANICMQSDVNNWRDEQVIDAVEAKLKKKNT